TILHNLVALGIGDIYPVGFSGDDGEGYELCRALRAKPGVRLDHFLMLPERRTFTYCKPLVLTPGKAPVELNRLDTKNWSPTPAFVQGRLIDSVSELATAASSRILLVQVGVSDTVGITSRRRASVSRITR